MKTLSTIVLFPFRLARLLVGIALYCYLGVDID